MKRPFSPWWLLVLAVEGVAALALVYFGTWSPPFHAESETLGQMGDFFGGLLNPLVSFLTLIVAISVWQLQQEELKLTRDELEQTKLAMKDQAETAEQQRQEQRFFDLLNVYFRTVENTRYTHSTHPSLYMRAYGAAVEHSDEIFEGKAAISNWLSRRTTVLSQYLKDKGSAIPGQSVLKPHIEGQWTKEAPDQYFDSYFRIVRHLLAEAQHLLGAQDQHYVALFRAQLSRTELVLLALHLWLDPEGQAVQHLAGQYGLLTNFPKGDLRTELEGEFPPELFTQPCVSSPVIRESRAVDGR